MANTWSGTPRHRAVVRVTHWLITFAFLALLVTGVEILISHPRFYWGESGHVGLPAAFELPIPASRRAVNTGYSFVLPDQNSWSRSLHFQAGWAAVFTGLLYVASGLRRNLLPSRTGPSWPGISSRQAAAHSYNGIQRLTYLSVIFVLFPLMIWTGLAMSPAFTGILPFTVKVFGGHQSARTIHFFLTISLTLFLLVHVLMVSLSGFRNRMRGMITGRVEQPREHA